MSDPDFELIDSLFLGIADKEEAQGFDSLTEVEKVVLLIWHASGIIGNGGIQYFYEQDLAPAKVAWAYEKIGCEKCSEILRISLSLFPDLIAQGSRDERVEFIQRNDELFYNLSCLFWDADKQMQKLLAGFVRSNSGKNAGG